MDIAFILLNLVTTILVFTATMKLIQINRAKRSAAKPVEVPQPATRFNRHDFKIRLKSIITAEKDTGAGLFYLSSGYERNMQEVFLHIMNGLGWPVAETVEFKKSCSGDSYYVVVNFRFIDRCTDHILLFQKYGSESMENELLEIHGIFKHYIKSGCPDGTMSEEPVESIVSRARGELEPDLLKRFGFMWKKEI